MPIIGRFSRRALLGAFAAVGSSTAAIAGVATSPKVFPDFGEIQAAPVGQADPFVETIAEYYAGAAEFAAFPDELIDMGDEEAFVMATYGPAFDRLWKDCPPATSLQGVAEAIRFTLGENCIGASSAEDVLRSALAFLDGKQSS
ncbi:hypothetical protein ACVILI_003447 [Mesorhizobium sp. USDA 4775]|nr:hypothetical protein [Mesorhizobium jarvisii]